MHRSDGCPYDPRSHGFEAIQDEREIVLVHLHRDLDRASVGIVSRVVKPVVPVDNIGLAKLAKSIGPARTE